MLWVDSVSSPLLGLPFTPHSMFRTVLFLPLLLSSLSTYHKRLCTTRNQLRNTKAEKDKHSARRMKDLTTSMCKPSCAQVPVTFVQMPSLAYSTSEQLAGHMHHQAEVVQGVTQFSETIYGALRVRRRGIFANKRGFKGIVFTLSHRQHPTCNSTKHATSANLTAAPMQQQPT